MIRPRYSYKLARTKLHSKRGILITSIVVASVLFATLISCIIVFTGAEKSAVTFVKKAGNDKYLVKVRPVIPDNVLLYTRNLSPHDITDITAFQKKYYENLKDKYQKAGVTYDSAMEVPVLQPDAFKPKTLPEDQRVSLNMQSPVLDAYREQRLQDYIKTAPNTLTHLRETGKKYGASGYYTEYPSAFSSIPKSHIVIDGKEDLSVTDAKQDGFTPYDSLVHAAYNSAYEFKDDSLLDRYLLMKDSSQLKGIPVIITAQEAAELFGKKVGIGNEPKGAAGQQVWFESIKHSLSGRTYQVCTRNATERTMLDKIQSDYADIQNHKDDKNYIPPALQYDYPTTPCGGIITKQDTRTTSEKAVDNKLIDTQKKLGTYQPPEHHMTTFQIVGLTYAHPYSEYSASASSYIQNLLTPQDTSMTATIPIGLYNKLPDSLKFQDQEHSTRMAIVAAYQTEQLSSRVLEFLSISQARAFLKNETCPSSVTGCTKLYTGDPYGSNYLILDEVGKLFQKIIGVILPVLVGFALVIMWFTISRIMAENRKETAVYRAMGASRSDIVVVYTAYTLLVALRILIVSFVIGIGVAWLINVLYGSQLTDIARVSFGVSAGNIRFSLFDLSSPLLLGVIGMILGISLLASIQPLIRNVLRSPITDMREE